MQAEEDFELDAHPGLAIRRGCERQAGQTRKMFDGRVAVQDLHKEDLNGHHRVDQGLRPGHASFAASLGNRRFRQFFGPILLEVFDDKALPCLAQALLR